MPLGAVLPLLLTSISHSIAIIYCDFTWASALCSLFVALLLSLVSSDPSSVLCCCAYFQYVYFDAQDTLTRTLHTVHGSDNQITSFESADYLSPMSTQIQASFLSEVYVIADIVIQTRKSIEEQQLFPYCN